MERIELAVIAHHEAGHVVAGYHEGFSLIDVTIRSAADTLGRASHQWCEPLGIEGDKKDRVQMENAVVVLLAGPIAEERFTGSRDSSHAHGDEEYAMRIVQRFETDDKVWTAWLGYLEERARALMWRHWRGWNEVEALAAALLEHESLDWAKALEVMTSAKDDAEISRRIEEQGKVDESDV